MGKEKENPSIRIEFDEEDRLFMEDYKEAYGVSVTAFIKSAVKKLIMEKKAKIHLNED